MDKPTKGPAQTEADLTTEERELLDDLLFDPMCFAPKTAEDAAMMASWRDEDWAPTEDEKRELVQKILKLRGTKE